MKKRLTYETPTSVEYVFELEGCIAQSLGSGTLQASQEIEGEWDDE